MTIVYDKAGSPKKCSDTDAKILIDSGHFTSEKAKAKAKAK